MGPIVKANFFFLSKLTIYKGNFNRLCFASSSFFLIIFLSIFSKINLWSPKIEIIFYRD